MYEPTAAAKTMLVEADRLDLHLTNLKVQKLLYLAHGLMLARHQAPLLNEPFRAWKYGPVIESLYHRLKVFGPDAVSASDPFIEPWAAMPTDAHQGKQAIADVLKQFGRKSGGQLVNLSHAPDGPWAQVYQADTSSSEIGNDLIEHYFRQLLVHAPAPAAV